MTALKPSRPDTQAARPGLPATLSVAGILGAIVCLFALASAAHGQAVSESAAAVSAKHVASLRKPGVAPEERQRIADLLLSQGEEGARQLARYAAGDIEPRTAAYLARLDKTCADLVRDRVKAGGGSQKVEAEVSGLRQKSLSVSRSRTLTEAAIKETCDPAIARLTELLQITPEQAAEKNSELKTARAEVIQIAAFFHASLEKLPAEQHKALGTMLQPVELEAVLVAREKHTCLLAMPMTPQDRATLSANLPVAAKLDQGEAMGIAELNRIRLLLGIGALAIDTKLCDASRGHSKDMKRLNFFDHNSPVPGKETPWKRAALAGTKAISENIYQGSVRGERAISVWWYSPGHHANMMGGGKRVGMGREDTYFTQMFGG